MQQILLHRVAHGANVNAQDIQLKTALHYAIQEHRQVDLSLIYFDET